VIEYTCISQWTDDLDTIVRVELNVDEEYERFTKVVPLKESCRTIGMATSTRMPGFGYWERWEPGFGEMLEKKTNCKRRWFHKCCKLIEGSYSFCITSARLIVLQIYGLHRLTSLS
jgi:hypothetical protein